MLRQREESLEAQHLLDGLRRESDRVAAAAAILARTASSSIAAASSGEALAASRSPSGRGSAPHLVRAYPEVQQLKGGNAQRRRRRARAEPDPDHDRPWREQLERRSV